MENFEEKFSRYWARAQQQAQSEKFVGDVMAALRAAPRRGNIFGRALRQLRQGRRGLMP